MSQKSLPSNPKGAEAIGSKDKSGIYIYIYVSKPGSNKVHIINPEVILSADLSLQPFIENASSF